uniref:Vitellogenin domain-containing protein n=1 Tax=Paramormyrops kingsleyae TaxID=1676925 RepID=A0A3B3R7Z2_9TELE
MVKTRDLRRCLHHRLAGVWPHSVPLSLDSEQAMDSKVQCVQRHGNAAMEEVNCTETVRLTPLAGRPAAAFVQSTSTLSLLRVQEVALMSPDTQVYTSDLWFEEETSGPGQAKPPELQDVTDTVRRLCTTKLDQQQQVNQFLHLVFQLRILSHQQLQDLWQEASFKCRDDWQPLADSLPACGSEACVSLMTELLQGGELEPERVSTFLSSLALIPRPTPNMLSAASALLRSPETRSGALLAVSALVNTLCQTAASPCSQMPQVQQLMEILKEMLEDHPREGGEPQLAEKLHVLKAVGNAGLAAATLVPELAACAQNQSVPIELRLAAIQAYRRIPCSAERQALLRLYRSPQEDVEVRIAAYQQLMRCPERDVLRKVRATLRDERSSQVGSYVWSHLTQIQKTDDPLKQDLMEALPDDIISKEFEGESWKYSSYMDATMDTGFGATNVEGALVFSPSSFIPRSAMANLTIHILGRAFNLLEIDIRAENMEPMLKELFGRKSPPSDGDSGPRTSAEASMREKRNSEPMEDAGRPKEEGEDGRCESAGSSRLRQAKAMFTGRQLLKGDLRCGLSAKVFGNELAFVTCDDVHAQVKQMSLNLAEVAVRLMKGQELRIHRRVVLATVELVLPSLSGWPIKVALNMSASLSLRLKGSASLKSWSHFSIAGYIKPSAYVGISARMGLEGVCGRAGVEWSMGLQTSTSLDGGVQLQRGQDLKVSLNTPEEVMDIIHFSSRTYSISGESREEVKGSRDHTEKSICTPQDWWKLLGWQLCSQVSYPSSPSGLVLPPAGPVQLSLRLVKRDKGLHQYLLEAAYSLLQQRGAWFPKEANLHVFLGTPQSTVPRDLSLDLTFSSINQQLALKVSHPLKTIHIQGKIDRVKSMRVVKVELLVDNVHHYYIKGLTEVQALPTELRLLSHLEAKVTADMHPIILSANLTRGLGRKISLAAMLKNVFRETASLSALVEWRMDQGQKQYSVDAEFFLPGLVGTQVFGLIQNSASLWNSALKLRYGLRAGDAQSRQKECHMAQTVRNTGEVTQAYQLMAEHEFHCSHSTFFNHKVLLKHEEASGQIQSSLDLSYGKHWNEINNKRRVLLSQSFKNESRHTLTSYLLEFSLQVLEKHIQYRTQLLHSHLRQNGVESSTHLKVNYNDQLPLVAGLHWRDYSRNRLWKWEGTFNMDTPWLYVYMAHKLNQPQRRALQFSTEVTARKWMTLRSLVLEGFYREKGREREGRLHLHTPTDTYLKTSGWGLLGKQGLKVSGSLSSAWTPVLRGDLSLEGTKQRKALQLASSYGRHNVSFSASLNTLDKRLRKRLVAIKMVLIEPQGAAVEFELEGGVEELKRSRELYQKQGTLRLRQPFLHFPQSLLLQEVFTVDLQRARYILESRANLGRSKECIHVLTLGYQATRPFVCSALSHPFSSEVIPHDSELCVTLHSNETQQEVHGTMRVNKKERLLVLGRIWNVSDSLQQGYGLQVNFTHAFQLRIPPSISLEGGLYWKPADDDTFDYLATGKTIISPLEECQLSVQLNGSSSELGLYSSLSLPYPSRIPRKVQAHARAELSAEGHMASSVSVKTDEEERFKLETDLLHTLEGDTRLLEGRAILHQKLLPILQDLQLQLSANVSEDRLSAACTAVQGGGAMQAQLSGAVGHGAGFGISVSGGLEHSLASLVAIPQTLGMEGTLRQTEQRTEGRLTVMAGEATYGLELNCRAGPDSTGRNLTKRGVPGAGADFEGVWLHMHAGEQSVNVNVSGSRGGPHGGGLHALLSHTSPQLSAKGIPSDASAQASWTWGERAVAMAAALQAGSEALQAELDGIRRGHGSSRWELSSRLQHHSAALLERGVPASMSAVGHCEVGARVVSTGLTVLVQDQRGHLHIEVGRTDSNARLAVSLGHDIRRLDGVLPESFQMNCSGHAAAAQLSARCSGVVAGFPIKTPIPRHFSMNGSLTTSRPGLLLDALLEGGPGERGELSLAMESSPQLHLRAAVRHSLPPLRLLGVPPRGTLTLSAHSGGRPSALLTVVLGPCEVMARLGAEPISGPGETGSSWATNWTNHCQALRDVGLPGSLELSGLVLLSPCRSALSSSLHVDGEALSLELGHACQPSQRFTGALTHSFSRLRGRGLPPESRVALLVPGGPGRNETLLLKVGSCQIRASRDVGPGGKSQWVWAAESACPLLEVQVSYFSF